MTDELSNSEVADDVASLRSFNINQPNNHQNYHGKSMDNYITPSALPLLDTRNKIDLCKGVLANISVQEKLKYLKIPIICIYSKMNCLVPLKHSDIIQKVNTFYFYSFLVKHRIPVEDSIINLCRSLPSCYLTKQQHYTSLVPKEININKVKE